jgi:hypothetical protein
MGGYYKKLLKQLLSLAINVADPAVYMISGLLPLEAEIHTKVFTMFGNIEAVVAVALFFFVFS